MRRIKLVSAMVIAGAMLVAACGGDDSDKSSDAKKDDKPTTASADGGSVKPASTSLGEVLVTTDGMTVYTFNQDIGGEVTCKAACAKTWPPVTLPSDKLPAGLSGPVYTVVERPDGAYQLAINSFPLYTFTGDKAPGDVKGQAVEGNWFVVKPNGQRILTGL